MNKIYNYLLYIKCLMNKGETDKYRSFALVTKLGHYILPKYKFNFPEIDWWNDVDFCAYLQKFNELQGFNSNRRWMLRQLLRTVSHIEGDTAECGVFLGASSYLILEANNDQNSTKIHHIFDSFQGLSQPDENDGKHWNSGNLAAPADEVIANLMPYENEKHYKLYEGWIPDRFDDVKNIDFKFVHVDVDLYQPTLDSIKFFYSRLKVGGVFLCDDYGFETCPGARQAVDDFLKDKEEKMIELPDGGGYFVKGLPVAK